MATLRKPRTVPGLTKVERELRKELVSTLKAQARGYLSVALIKRIQEFAEIVIKEPSPEDIDRKIDEELQKKESRAADEAIIAILILYLTRGGEKVNDDLISGEVTQGGAILALTRLTREQILANVVGNIARDTKAGAPLGTPSPSSLLGNILGIGEDGLTRVPQTTIDAIIDSENANLITGIRETTRKRVKQYLKDNLNKPAEEIIAGLSKIDDIQTARAYTIARTELSITQNSVTQEYMNINGLNIKQWKVIDPKDIGCLMNKDAIVTGNERFPSGDLGAPLHVNCWKTDTSIFTTRGVLSYDEIKVGDHVFTMDDDMNIVTSPVTDIFLKKNQEILEWKGKCVSMAITPDHKVIRVDEWKNKGGVREINFFNASELVDLTSFLMPQSVNNPNKELDISDDMLTFWAWYVGDGSITKVGNKYRIVISKDRELKPNKHNEILTIAERIFKERVYSLKTQIQITLDDGDFAQEVLSLGKAYTKKLPFDYTKLSSRQAKLFIDTYASGDGHIKKGKLYDGYQTNPSMSLFTTSPQLLSELSYVVYLSGYSVSIGVQEPKTVIHRNGTYTSKHPCFTINVKTSENISVYNKHLTRTTGDVFGITVKDFHRVLAVRNGKAFWTGNCMCYVVPLI